MLKAINLTGGAAARVDMGFDLTWLSASLTLEPTNTVLPIPIILAPHDAEVINTA